MEPDTLRNYLAGKKGVAEEFPFGPKAMVFKVMGKMFALVSWTETPMRMNLKCDPDLALCLREMYEAVLPGYHMNKKHWNTVVLDNTIPDDEVFSMIDDSYVLVVKKLRKADRDKYEK